MKKLLLVLGILVVGGAVAVAVTLRMRGNGDAAVAVETEPVEMREIVQTVSATGRIQPKTQVKISADISAKITNLTVKEGDWVEKGALLIELDHKQYQAAVESGEASLRVAQANAEVTHENRIKLEKDFARVEELFDKELETEERLDAAHASLKAERARLRSALDQVEQVRATLKQRQDEFSKTRIFAPIAGTVSQLNKEEGEIALGSQFQEDVIMVIATLSGMEALVDVDESDIVSVAIGDAATIEVDALSDREFHGEVTEIANTAKVSAAGTTDQKTEFEVKIAITDPVDELRPGMTASGEIVTDTRESAVAVPIQCVAVRTAEQLGGDAGDEGEDRWVADDDGFVEVVFVVEDGVVEARQVECGIQSEAHIEVVDGLEVGEKVVIGNYRAISRELQHGSAVTADKPGGGDA